MSSRIQLLSTDFDGTLVSHAGEPALDRQCMELIRELQASGAFVDPGLPKNHLIVDTTMLSASDSASFIATKLGFEFPTNRED